MSDAIREAFEALEWLFKSSNLPDRAAKYNQVKVALQSQTAPAALSVAVSEEIRESVAEAIAEALGDAMDCTRVWSAWGVGTMGESDFVEVASDAERINEITEAAINAMLAAAPQPDLAGLYQDAEGKVAVTELGQPVGLVTDDSPLLGGQGLAPVQSENEVKAQALEAAWDKLYDTAEDLGIDHPEKASGIMTAAEYLRAEVARLRGDKEVE